MPFIVVKDKLRRPAGPVAVAAGLLALLTSLPARALDPDKPLGACTVDVWSARRGLPSSFVRAISQTEDGYLWIAGYGGVGRYDGARIVTLPQPTPLARIFDTQTFKLDQQGTLWLISSKGTPVCLREGVARDCLPATVELPPDTRLVDAHPDADGTAWLASRTGLLRYFPGPPPRLVPVPTPAVGRAVLVHRDRQGRVWLGSESGLFRAGKDGGSFTLARAGATPLDAAVRAHFETPAGRLWFLFDHRLVRVEGDELQIVPGPFGRADQVIEDRDGNVWIGTRAGLTRFQLRTGRWDSYTTRDGLPEDEITALHEDREGSLWVGTRSAGLAQFTDRVVNTPAAPPAARALDHVASLCQDASGAYWFGAKDGLLRWQGAEERLFTTRDGLPARVSAVAPGADGALWVGTARGLARVVAGHIDVPVPSTDEVTALHVDGGTVWFALLTRLLRLEGGKLAEVGQSSQGPIRAIEADEQGRIWIAGNLGVARLEGNGLQPVELPEGSHPGRALHRDREGRLWLTTSTDIARLSPGPIRFLGPTVAFGGRQLFQMAEDDRGSYWVGTSRGLLRLPKARVLALADGHATSIDPLSLETDDRRRDILAFNTRDRGVWKDTDGRVWFATEKGAIMVDPARLRVNERPPTVRIDEATADAHPLQRDSPNLLPPGPGNLAFHFSALTLLEPDKSRHRYRLEGFEPDWVDAGTARTATYTNIPPGKYRFHVQGSNADGVWNEAGDFRALQLRPYFYRTAWFYAAAALALLGIVTLLWRQRVRGLRRGYLVALAERARVARELHDTLLQGMAAVSLKLRGLRRQLGPDASGPARELAAIDTLVVTALEETRQFLGGLRGHDRASDLTLALDRMASRLTEGHDITCEVVQEGAPRALPDDVKGDLFRIAQEAIHNAVKHAHPSRVEVKLAYDQAAARLTVTDDGRGFAPSDAVGAAEGHFGLVGMRERGIRVGSFALTSHPGQGTSIAVEVPLD